MASRTPAYGVALTAALALLGVTIRSPSRAGPAPPLPGTVVIVSRPSKPAPRKPLHVAITLLRRALGDTDDTALKHDPAMCRIQVLIATLPDPVDSHLDWMFDLQLEALRKAYGAAGFVSDQYAMPWARGGGGDSARDSPPRDSAVWRNVPGVMLFRNVKDNRIAVLLVVSEMPTSGVRQAAFQAALAERKSVLAICPCARGAGVIQVLGPTFAGSGQSLHHVLARWTRGGTTARVISGAATSTDVASAIDTVDISFQTMVHSDDDLTAARRDVIDSHASADSTQRAIIAEGSTAYGLERLKDPTTPQATLRIRFPLNVATLRGAYERNRGIDSGAGGLRGSVPRLPVDWQDPRNAIEILPPMSALTLPTVDQGVEDVARMLRAHNVRQIEIDATDVRDKMFLAYQVRHRVPDELLITREGHMLYGHPDLAQDLRGMLVISSYPPDLHNQTRVIADTTERGARLVFPWDGAEGTYNAALVFLGETNRLVDYRDPFDSVHALPPPVWISIVGDGGVVPITTYRVPADLQTRSHAYPPATGGRVQSEHRPQRLLLLLIAVAIAVVAIVIAWRSQSASPEVQSRLTSTLGLWIALLPVFAGVQVSGYDADPFVYILGQIIVWIGLGAVLLTLGTYLVRAGTRVFTAPRATLRLHEWLSDVDRLPVIAADVVMAVLATVFVYSLKAFDSPVGDRALLFDRVTSFTRGVSPIAPVVLIGFGILTWGWWNRKRLHHLAHWAAPIEGEWLESGTLAGHVKNIRGRMTRAAYDTPMRVFLLALFVVSLFHVAAVHAPVERVSSGWLGNWGVRSYELLLGVGIVLGISVPLWMTVQFWVIWRELRLMLDGVARLPLFSAFERLPIFAARVTQLTIVGGAWGCRHDGLMAVTGLQKGHLTTLQPQTPVTFTRVWQILTTLWQNEPDKVVRKATVSALTDLPKRGDDATYALQPALSSAFRREFPDLDRLWLRGAEEWFAVHLVFYVEWVFQHLMRIIRFVLCSVVFTTLLLSSYVFYPQDYMTRLFFALIALCAIALVAGLAQINRHDVVSAITNTTPGKVTWDRSFVTNVVLLGGVPLLTVLSAIFPPIRGFLFAWVRPLLDSIGKGG
jgi:hypothetical protein